MSSFKIEITRNAIITPFVFIVRVIVFLWCLALPAHAASKWQTGLGYKARLLEGTQQANGSYKAALQIVLDEGWKTYWRTPGENGIPPKLDFSGSDNLSDIVLHWPAPVVFQDATGTGIGYKKHLTLPFDIRPEVSGKDVTLHLAAFFGVCAQICVPADVALRAHFSPRDLPQNDLPQSDQHQIDQALQNVPHASSGTGFDIADARFQSGLEDEKVILDLKLPAGTGQITVLTEGPEDWYFDPLSIKHDNAATPQDSAPQAIKIHVPLYRYERGAGLSGDERLVVTVITETMAVEKTILLK